MLSAGRAAGARLVVALVLLTLAACSTTESGSARARRTTSPSPSQAPPSPTPAAPSPAADGTNVAACRDGACEITVTAPADIPLDGALEVRSINVSAIGPDDVTFFIVLGSGAFSVSCDGDDRCMTSVTGATAGSPAFVQSTGHPGARITVNRLTIEVVTVADGTALVRMSAA